MKTLVSAALAALALLALTALPAMAADKNCEDFNSQREAQAYFKSHGGSRTNNVDDLDRDHDGRACENQDYGSGGNGGGGNSNGGNGGGGNTGGNAGGNNAGGNGGGNGNGDPELPPTATLEAAPSSSPMPLLLTALGIGVFGLFARRRFGVRA